MAAGGSNDRCVVPPNLQENGALHNGVVKTRQCCQKFSPLDATFVVISLVTYLGDLITDCVLAGQYFYHGHVIWGSWTLVFVLVPTITLQLFSLRWYISEKPVHCGSWKMVAHLVLLGPIERYVSVLKYGMRARKSNSPQDYKKLYHAQNDVSILRLVEAFMESAPQLLLQGYGILTAQEITWLTGLSSAFSLLSLAWAVASYSNALRLAYREAYMTNWCGLLIQTCWQICTVSSRVLAIVIFATVFQAWTFLAVGLHWLAMTVWVIIQGTDFCTRWWEEKLFNCVIGLVYIFSFLNLKDGDTRYRMVAFHVVMLLENGLLVGLWYHQRPVVDTLMIVVMAVVFGGFLLGILCMLLYYRCCHPSGPIQLCRERESEEPVNSSQEDGINRRLVFDPSVMSQSLPFPNTGYDLSLDSSWSGLVHSRRGDEPTFTTSKYRGTSRHLDFENSDLHNKVGENCKQLFSTPLCGHPNPKSARLCHHHSDTSGVLHLTDTLGSDQSYHLSDACLVCSTLKSCSSSRDALICSSNKSEEEFASQSESISLDLSHHQANSPPQSVGGGYYNPAFSTTSLTSVRTSNCPQDRVLQSCRNMTSMGSVLALSASLPALSPADGNALQLYQPGKRRTNPRNLQSASISQQSSVFAITGTPRESVAGSVGNVSRHSKALSSKSPWASFPRFGHAQSLQCIPTNTVSDHDMAYNRSHTGESYSSNLRLNVVDCRSRESLSSMSSSVRPRPLSPLNALSLWEESLDRFSKSYGFDEAGQKLINSLNMSNSECQSFGGDPSLCRRNGSSVTSCSHRSPASLVSPYQQSPAHTRNRPPIFGADISTNKDSSSRSSHGQDDLSEACFAALESRTTRQDSSGFQSPEKEESTDYFDYSDAGLTESHHTLSDLAWRLQIGLDLNESTDGKAPASNLSQISSVNPSYSRDEMHSTRHDPMLFSDTPWRIDYMQRVPTPVLSQSQLSLYSASDHSLSQASNLRLSDGPGHLPVTSQLKHLGNKHIPLSLYAGSNGSLHSVHRLDPTQKPLINHVGERGKQRTPMKIYSLKKSPLRVGRNVDLFDSEVWRSSISSPEANKKLGHPLKLEQYGKSPNNFHRRSMLKTSTDGKSCDGEMSCRQRHHSRHARLGNQQFTPKGMRNSEHSDDPFISGSGSSASHKPQATGSLGSKNRSNCSSNYTSDLGPHPNALSPRSLDPNMPRAREQRTDESLGSRNRSNCSNSSSRNRSNCSSNSSSRNRSNCSSNSSRNKSNRSSNGRTSDSGQHSSGFDSSSSSVWNSISHSDTAEDIGPHLISPSERQIAVAKPCDSSSTTPNFSPIERTGLPPLRVRPTPMEMRSYFSTPKVRWPPGEELHLSRSRNTTEDSFFSLSLPRFREKSCNKNTHASVLTVSSLEDIRLKQGSEMESVGRGKENTPGRRKREQSKNSLSSSSTPSPRQPLHSINQRL